jgi:type IV fimbrial biogenesis protein FimT
MKRISLGFTLLNLLVTLSVSSILATFGIPTLSELISNSQVNSTYQRLFTLIQYARTESVSYSSQVLICPTENKIDCVDNWNLPLMVFVDLNYDEVRNDEEMILRETKRLTGEEHLDWRTSGSRRYLRFKYDGTTRNQNGRLSYCLRKGERIYAQQIIMTMAGRARRAENSTAIARCRAI